VPELYELVGLVALAAATAMVAKRLGLLTPILLLVVGIAVSYLPGELEVHLDPDVVLWGILPPLVYVTANQMGSPIAAC
jgi:monovalent cation/hydrogen antiporter